MLIHKPIGKTPLQAIKALQRKRPQLQKVKLGYAGRLDPMAQGLLLVLEGEENKKKHLYENLTKTYEVDILFGIATDTYDVMGKITAQKPPAIHKERVEKTLKEYEGTFAQAYPPYSSKAVNGKPLFKWARENRLHEIPIPTKDVTIFSITLQQWRTCSSQELKGRVAIVKSVEGVFRQEDIIKEWEKYFAIYPDVVYPLLTVTVTASSGTYMRLLAHALGEKVGIPALAFGIKRTAIGEFTLRDALKI